MADIPFLIYLCDVQGNGGDPATRAPTEGAAIGGLGGLWGIYRNMPKAGRSIPFDTATGLPPVSPAYTPQWDGSFNSNNGAFVVFHHTNGLNMLFPVVPGCRGDNWYEGSGASQGGGITPWNMLMQLAAEKWGGSSPWFKGFKIATAGGFGSGGDPLNSSGVWTSSIDAQ